MLEKNADVAVKKSPTYALNFLYENSIGSSPVHAQQAVSGKGTARCILQSRCLLVVFAVNYLLNSIFQQLIPTDPSISWANQRHILGCHPLHPDVQIERMQWGVATSLAEPSASLDLSSEDDDDDGLGWTGVFGDFPIVALAVISLLAINPFCDVVRTSSALMRVDLYGMNQMSASSLGKTFIMSSTHACQVLARIALLSLSCATSWASTTCAAIYWRSWSVSSEVLSRIAGPRAVPLKRAATPRLSKYSVVQSQLRPEFFWDY